MIMAKRLLMPGLALLKKPTYCGYINLQALAESPDINVPTWPPGFCGPCTNPHIRYEFTSYSRQTVRLAGADMVVYPSPFGKPSFKRTLSANSSSFEQPLVSH